MFPAAAISRNLTKCNRIFGSTTILQRTLSSIHDDNKAQNQKIIATDRLVKPMERVDGMDDDIYFYKMSTFNDMETNFFNNFFFSCSCSPIHLIFKNI